MGDTLIRVSDEVRTALEAKKNDGESFDSILRQLLCLGARAISGGRPFGPNDGRKRSPIYNMEVGAVLIIPWNRDKFHNAGPEIAAANRAVASANRSKAFKFVTAATGAGLQIHRVS